MLATESVQDVTSILTNMPLCLQMDLGSSPDDWAEMGWGEFPPKSAPGEREFVSLGLPMTPPRQMSPRPAGGRFSFHIFPTAKKAFKRMDQRTDQN